MVRKLRAVLLAVAVAGIASQLGCFVAAGMAVGTIIRSQIVQNKEGDDEWLLPDGGKPVRTPTHRPAAASSDSGPIPDEWAW